MQEFIAVIYLFIICLAFWGYGRALLASLSPVSGCGIGISFALGICLFILACGYLELFHIAGESIFEVFTCIGLLLALFRLFLQNRSLLRLRIRPNDWEFTIINSEPLSYLSILLAIACFLITFNYFYTLPLNVHDDFNGYLILAQRILQEGFQGGDPFNDHSIEQGFGAGNYFLALAVNLLPLMSLHLADAGIGLLLLSAFILDSLKKSPHFSIKSIGPCIFILCITVINAPIVNTTPLLVACGLFLAVIVFYIQSDFGAKLQDHAVFALLLSSFLTLKGNYIIPVVAISFSIYLSRSQITGFFQAFKEISIFFVCMLIFTLPWMISNWRFSETAFYPLLGHGLVTPNALSIASLPQFIDANLTLFPSYCLLICLLTIFFKSSQKVNQSILFFIGCLSITVVSFSCALTMTSAGLFTRYSYVSLFGPTIFLLIYIVFNTSLKTFIIDATKSPLKILSLLILVIVCAPQFIYGIKHATKETVKNLNSKQEHISRSMNVEKEKERVRDLQKAIPEGSKVLLRLDMPFLADFTQQKIFVMDWPGNVGPTPGVPFSEPPEALARYLRAQGIQYIIYSYKNEALYSSKNPELIERINHPNPWIKTQTLRAFAVQNQIESLSLQHPIIYDNGQDYVIDLNTMTQ